MPEKLGLAAPSDTPSIDPIAYDDNTIFGLDPAVHWVHWNNQREQFPEIVVEITNHWDEIDWLEKLLNRLGYTADLYDAEKNPRGIFDRLPAKEKTNLTAIRWFLLRAAGTNSEKINQMFGLTRSNHTTWRLKKANLDDVTKRRNTLSQKSQRTS